MQESTEARTLVVERRRGQQNKTVTLGDERATLSLTPPIDEDYWAYRVRLSDRQAIVAFPKFFTIGIGFAVEEDWNTNLPYTADASEIAAHIMHNKGDDSISNDAVVDAIQLIRQAITADALKAAAS